VIDLVNRNLIGIQFDREVAVQRWIIQKIGFDDLGFVPKTKHKRFESMMRIGPHDMP
jgi:hypothetical protein